MPLVSSSLWSEPWSSLLERSKSLSRHEVGLVRRSPALCRYRAIVHYNHPQAGRVSNPGSQSSRWARPQVAKRHHTEHAHRSAWEGMQEKQVGIDANWWLNRKDNIWEIWDVAALEGTAIATNMALHFAWQTSHMLQLTVAHTHTHTHTHTHYCLTSSFCTGLCLSSEL
jgi:hypothetical protein